MLYPLPSRLYTAFLASSARTPLVVLVVGAAFTVAAAREVVAAAGPEAPFVISTVATVVVAGAAMTLVLAGLAGLQAHARRQAEVAWRRAEAARAEAEAARDLAEQASRVKDEFLATVSHELRTPLNAMLGWAQLLRRGGAVSPEVDHGLVVIVRNAKAQARIVDDLLDMSRMICGRLRLELWPVDLSVAVAAAVESARPAAQAKRIVIDVVAPPGDALVRGDSLRLQQIAWNLISNALKFTPGNGGVRIVVERSGKTVSLMVADTGQGMDAAFLPHAFDLFTQADGSSTRRHGGLGLGLPIVRHLVELHGGTVKAESHGPGKGSSFTVEFPAADCDAVPSGESAESAVTTGVLSRLTVLAVDDDVDTRELIQSVLSAAGARVIPASGADEALALLKNCRPDVLVGDIGMPGIDGLEMLRRVREQSALAGGATPAVALTAFATQADRNKALAVGFNEYLAKPADAGDLVAAVARVAGRGVQVANTTPSEAKPALAEAIASSRRQRLGLDDA